MKKHLIIALFLLLYVALGAQNQISLSDKDKIYSIGHDVYFYIDSTKSLTIEDICKDEFQNYFEQSTQDVPNLKKTISTIWMKFTVDFQEEDEWMFEYAAPYIESVEFYTVFKDKSYEVSISGTKYNFEDREINVPNFVFNLNPVSTVYYLKVETTFNPQFPVKILTKDKLSEKDNSTDLFNGIYFGLIVLIILYNFFIWLSAREKIYILYVFYAFAIGFLIFMNKGLAFKFLWPNTPQLNMYLYTSASLLSISSILFAVHFLKMKKYVPFFRKALLVISGIFIIVIAVDLFGFHNLSSSLSQNLSSLLTIIILPLVIIIFKKGHKPAMFFLIAWGFYVIGALIHLLRLSAVLPYNNFTANSLQIGSALEMILLSFAVADLINRLKKENEEIIRNQNIKLEAEVKIRTAELNEKQEEILAQNHELTVQKEIIEEIHHQTQASINYAKNIQEAAFPSKLTLLRYFSDFFTIFMPRDIVSGDFYWAKEIDKKLYFAVADCTGHGVPGALVSMLGISLLNEVTVTTHETDSILENMRSGLKKALKQTTFSKSQDGIDIALCKFTPETKKIEYSGAYNPLLIVRKEEIITLNPDRQPIGIHALEKNFTKKEIYLQEGDKLFLFTDGYTDQLNLDGERFKIHRLREAILEFKDENIQQQKQLFIERFDTWRNNFKQIDDILVLGIQV